LNKVFLMSRRTEAELQSLSSAAKLRMLLKEIESNLGLVELTEAERDVLYAARIASRSEPDGSHVFASEELRENGFVDQIAPATFYRALKALRDRGFVQLAPGYRKNHYVLAFEAAIGKAGAGNGGAPGRALRNV
jgi:hypothetical protein